MISIEHGTRQLDREQNQQRLSLTWIGPKDELDAYVATLTIGNWYEGMGQFTNWSISQNAGPLWELELQYVITYRDDGSIGNIDDDDEASGPDTQTLQARTVSMPIETHFNYETRWNHFLAGRRYKAANGTVYDYTRIIPPWWSTATDPYIAPSIENNDIYNYRWVKSLDCLPMPDEDRNEVWGVVKNPTTGVVCTPRKPGLETYDKTFYTITEIGEHRNKIAAGWATRALVNSIIASPLLGDFGLTPAGYNWKVDSIDVAYTGKRWRATRTYTRSGDRRGWDQDIYN